MARVGLGFDVHRLAEGRALVLGGVRIEHPLGLDGHSDADVVLHAVADAVLGAAGQGDIGDHFPDTDPALAGMDSARIVGDAIERADRVGLRPINVDVIVFAEQPRLGPVKQAIARRIAELMHLAPTAVNVKAKTAERLGVVGNGQAIACQAVVLMQ